MAIIIILALTMLFMWGTAVFTYGSATVENGKYVLGITLPTEYRRDSEVLGIIADYRRVRKRIHLAGLASCVPVLLLNGYFSFAFLFLMIWFGLVIWFHQENVERCARKLYQVKQKNGWLTGSAHVVRIDTVLSSLKDKGLVKAWWLIPAYLSGVIGCCLAWQGTAGTGGNAGAGRWSGLFPWGIVVSFVVTELLLLLAYVGIKRARPQVICSETSVNQKMDRIMRREWSRCLILHSYGVAALTVYMGWMEKRNAAAGDYMTTGSYSLTGLIVLLGTVGSVYTIYLSWHNVKKARERMLSALSETDTQVYGDDDEYWLNGYPAGMRPGGLSEKRIGIGWTTNASLKCETTDKVILIFIAAFVVGICLFLIPFDFAQVKMEIGEGSCCVSAASMGCSFDLKDVEAVTLIKERPAMSKKNGFDSNRFFLGDFRVEGYGTCKVFVSLKNDMVIRVDTKDRIIWFNSESTDAALAFYEALSGAVAEE